MTTTTFTVLVTITDAPGVCYPTRPEDVAEYLKGAVESSGAHMVHATAYRGDLTHLGCAADWGSTPTDRDRLHTDRLDHAYVRLDRG